MTRTVKTHLPAAARRESRAPRAFTLMELIVVITIIVILVTLTMPAIRSIGKSNDESQATNLVRSLISNARGIAIAQHRMAGVVFFEETSTYSFPANPGQTAAQLFIEDFNQAKFLTDYNSVTSTRPSPDNLPAPAGTTGFVKYTSARQYLPANMKLAALSDGSAGIAETGDTAISIDPSTQKITADYRARVILFDSNGQLVTRGQLAAPAIPAPLAGPADGGYPRAYGDWRFLGVPNRDVNPTLTVVAVTADNSSPGFFLYRKDEYENQKDMKDAANDKLLKQTWLRKNSSVILVNPNTGTVLIDKGPGQ